jgi:integrase
MDQLIDAARSTRWGVRDSSLLLRMFSHGLRVHEATEMKWTQLDLDIRVFRVHKKNGRGRPRAHLGKRFRLFSLTHGPYAPPRFIVRHGNATRRLRRRSSLRQCACDRSPL